MTRDLPAFEAHRTDSATLGRLRRVEQGCLGAAAGIATAALARQTLPGLEGILQWAGLPLVLAVSALASAASLACSLRLTIRKWWVFSTALAVLAAIFASRALLTEVHRSVDANARPGSIPALVALAFLVLAISVAIQPIRAGVAGYAPDVALFGVGWLVAGLLIGKALREVSRTTTTPRQIHPATIAVLTLLTFVAFARRAEIGHFSIFLSRGVAGRVARGLLPVLLLLPTLREALRSRAIRFTWLPEQYAAGILASLGTMVALLLVMVLARQLRRLEREIQDLSLRDELTGLYNLRGFQILAEQALRLSHRSQIPFSVLFVDVDDLKQINDRQGHSTGSRLLVQTAEFLTAHFRETDIVARIGGDEFAVAGHFTQNAIEMAEERLRADSQTGDRTARLSLSMGHASTDPRRPQLLDELLERADAAMYEQKRQKKLQPAEAGSDAGLLARR